MTKGVRAALEAGEEDVTSSGTGGTRRTAMDALHEVARALDRVSEPEGASRMAPADVVEVASDAGTVMKLIDVLERMTRPTVWGN